MNKTLKNKPVHDNPTDDDDFEAFMEAVENMDPEEARIMYQNVIAAMEEEGEEVPFTLRLLTSDVLYGTLQTPAGLVYGIGGNGQLLLTGFITQEDIDEMGDAESVLQAIMEDFEETCPTAKIVRDNSTIGAMINSALSGQYQIHAEILDGLEGTELQQKVWKELLKIPYGTTISYEELAKRTGEPKAVRAVASAVGNNPLSIVIPCHRVVRKDGETGDYYWGSDIKEKLLAHEKANRKA